MAAPATASPVSPPYLRLPLVFDPELLAHDLARVAESHWTAHFNQAIYEGDWCGAALRAAPSSVIAIYSDPGASEWVDTPLLQDCGYFRQVLDAFHCPLLSVRLLRLGPGAVINEHRDPMLGLGCGEVRIHVVVATNPDVECRIAGVAQHWAAGECWYADFSRPHSFANRGATARIHMVLDCRVDDWLLSLLADGDSPPAAVPQAAVASLPAPGEGIDLLRRRVHGDPALQARLSAHDDCEAFIADVTSLAAELGHPLAADDVRSALRAGRRARFERNRP